MTSNQHKKPSGALLRPDLPCKSPKRLRGEKYTFTPKKPLNLIPPIHNMRVSGPEETHQASIEAELRTILTKHDLFDECVKEDYPEDIEALIKDLLRWRRA